jgi:hypothetical protein
MASSSLPDGAMATGFESPSDDRRICHTRARVGAHIFPSYEGEGVACRQLGWISPRHGSCVCWNDVTKRLTNAGRPTATDERLDRLETKTDRLETKVDQLETKVDRLETKVDQRFDEQRAHTNALFEASRTDFNNLYDFVKAQAASTDARLDQIQTEAMARAVDLQAAIAALAPRLRRAGQRR